MKIIQHAFPLLAALLLTCPGADARDDHLSLPLGSTQAPAAQSKLDQGVKLYFGKQKHPKPIKRSANGKPTRKPTPSTNQTRKHANGRSPAPRSNCQARPEGRWQRCRRHQESNYKAGKTAVRPEYPAAPAMMAGVAFKGTVVKLP